MRANNSLSLSLLSTWIGSSRFFCIAVTAGLRNKSQIGNGYGAYSCSTPFVQYNVCWFLFEKIMIYSIRFHRLYDLWYQQVSLSYMLVATLSIDLPHVDCCARGGMHAFFCPVRHSRYHLLHQVRVWLALWDVEALPFEMHSKVSLAWILGLDSGLLLVHVPRIMLSIKILNFFAFPFKCTVKQFNLIQ